MSIHNNHLLLSSSLVCSLVVRSAYAVISIHSQMELKKLCALPDSSFELAQDIYIDSSEAWKPCEFHGRLFGNQHTIYNLNISHSNGEPVGFFSKLTPQSKFKCSGPLWVADKWNDTCKISDKDQPIVSAVKFENATIRGNGAAGILAGHAQYAMISDIEAKGDVEGSNGVGGLLGMAGPLTNVSHCKIEGSVRGDRLVGGIVGSLFFSQITYAESEVNVSGQDLVGGIAGRAGSAVVSDVISRSLIQARDTVGGILGAFYGSNRGKVHPFRKGCIELYSDIDERFLKAFRMDEYASNFVDDMEMTDGVRFKYRGYSSSSEPDGSLPFFNFWYGAIGDSRFDFAAHEQRLFEGKENCERIFSGVSVESRMFFAYSAGEIECRNVCGGISGSNSDDVVSMSNLMHSGLIYGGRFVGQFMGTGTGLVRPINYISSGLVVSGRAPWKLFGIPPKRVGWVLQLAPPRLRDPISSHEALGFAPAFNLTQGSGNVRWFGRFYPPGLYFPKWLKDSSIRFERFSSRASLEPCSIVFEREWVSKELGGCTGLMSKKQATGFWRSMASSFIGPFFPPVPNRAAEDVPTDRCINLRKLFQGGKMKAIEFTIRDANKNWILKDSILCRNDSNRGSPVLVRAKNNWSIQAGQAWFQIFPKNESN
ncbi:MAG: hypothetical protein IPN71_23145 [Fibrobacteres bacterium]|nr:hypothetical protein [Fibrobacterota bacterium]